MATKQKNTSYTKAKDAFDALELEDKAVFIVDAVFKTVLGGMEQFTSAVSDAVEEMTSRSANGNDAEAEDAEPSAPKKKTEKKSATKAAGKRSTTKAAKPKETTDE